VGEQAAGERASEQAYERERGDGAGVRAWVGGGASLSGGYGGSIGRSVDC